MTRDFQLPGRSAAYGRGGMAATSHPAATLTAIEVLKGGGNAVDAAVAASALLAVVEPAMSGFGGDMFALVAGRSGKVFALASAGQSPAATDADALRRQGLAEIPGLSPHAVTVPGYTAGIEALSERFGTRPLDELLRPAIEAAEDGFVVTPRVAHDWANARERLNGNQASRAVHLPGGSAPKPGDLFAYPLLARTLRRIAGLGAGEFYKGETANAMIASLRELGGVHAEEDFAAFAPRWVQPISVPFRDVLVYECPPPGQGVVALLLLNMLQQLRLDDLDPLGPERTHLEAEATKLAFAERDRHLADPEASPVPLNALLSESFAQQLANRIDRGRAGPDAPESSLQAHPDTTYLTVADRDGTVCSFISSLYDSFGSCVTCPRTGVTFQSRGRGFSLKPDHPNELAPAKRPMHTIIPAVILKDGLPAIGFGVMGGDYQPVGHARLLSNLLIYGMNPQAALEQPRAMAYPRGLQLERGVPAGVADALKSMGHAVRPAESPLGGGQCILLDHRNGTMIGGSDPRKDGTALGC